MEYGAIGHRLATAQRMLCYLPFIFIPTHPREKRSQRKLNLIRISILQIRILFLFLVKLFTLTQNLIRKIHGKNTLQWRTRKKSDNNKKFTKSLLKTNIQREINQNEQIEFQLERFVAVFFFGKWKFIVKLLQFPIYSSILLLLAHYNRSTHLVVVVFLRCSLSWLLLFFHLLFIMLSLSWLHRIIIY